MNLMAHIVTMVSIVLATPRWIGVIENNCQADGSIKISKDLQTYIGSIEVIKPKNSKKT